MREDGNIRRAVVGEVLRLALFLVYYVALICLGAAVLAGAVFAAWHLSFEVLPTVRNGRAIVALCVAIAGMLALAGTFGIYLVKPLFSFTRSANDERVEVFEKDCPELFGLIRGLSADTGFKMPRHVYLTTDVNACVFYNSGFWSIFLPVRKNLEIGLGLFNSTTVQEVKAILAHEFGHFGQSSMKVGSAVAVTNNVLYNLIYTDDFIDRALSSWRTSSLALWKLFGLVASGMTDAVKWLTQRVFVFVERGERKLSRLMEFGADEVACRCAGTEAFVSAMCKSDYLATCDGEWLKMFLGNCLAGGRLPDNYFRAHDAVMDELCKRGLPPVSVSDVVGSPYDFDVVASRLKVADIWSSHPDLSDRLERARELAARREDADLSPSWGIIPEDVAQKVSDRLFEVATSGMENKPAIVSYADFRAFVEKSYEEQGMPPRFKPFFCRIPEKFDLQKALCTAVAESPFSDGYKRLVGELDTAKGDMATLNKIVSGEVEARTFLYNGKEYTRKTAPVDQHKKYLDELAAQVAQMDSAACSYLSHIGGEEDRRHVRKQYEDMAAVESLQEELEKRISAHDGPLARLFAKADFGGLEKSEFRALCEEVVAMEADVQNGIEEISSKLPDAIIGNEAWRGVAEYAGKKHNTKSEFEAESFQELQNVRAALSSLLSDYHYKCRQALARFAASKA